jgi:hypothetical protein
MEKFGAYLFFPDGGRRFLQNRGSVLPGYMVSYQRVVFIRILDLRRCRKFPSMMRVIHRGLWSRCVTIDCMLLEKQKCITCL